MFGGAVGNYHYALSWLYTCWSVLGVVELYAKDRSCGHYLRGVVQKGVSGGGHFQASADRMPSLVILHLSQEVPVINFMDEQRWLESKGGHA